MCGQKDNESRPFTFSFDAQSLRQIFNAVDQIDESPTFQTKEISTESESGPIGLYRIVLVFPLQGGAFGRGPRFA